jgi:hypothetical protein
LTCAWNVDDQIVDATEYAIGLWSRHKLQVLALVPDLIWQECRIQSLRVDRMNMHMLQHELVALNQADNLITWLKVVESFFLDLWMVESEWVNIVALLG